MTKLLEALKPELFEGTICSKSHLSSTEKSRDYYDVYPGTKAVRPFVSEEEYREVCEAHKE